MLRITLAGMRAHPMRHAMTGVVVLLSAAFIAGTLVLTDSLNRAAEAEGAVSAEHLRVPLLMLGAVSLIVAAFVIANTFRILVAQRTRELALLRAVGATRRQASVGILWEAALVGLLGGLAGLGLGSVLGYVVAARVAAGTHDLPIVVAAPSLIWPVVIGVLVTVASAVPPALAATRVSPQAAVRSLPDGDDSRPVRRVRRLGGLALILTGSVFLLLGATVPAALFGLVAVVAGASVCFLGILVLGPTIVPPLLGAAGALVGWLRGSQRSTVDLATANAVRNPRRAAATSAALLIGVTVVTGFVTVSESTRASIGVVIDRQVPADFVLTTSVGDEVPPSAIEAIEALPEMGDSVALYRGTVDVPEFGNVEINGLDLAAYDRIARVDGVGSLDDLASSDAAVDHATAAQHDVGVGDVLTIDGQAFRVGYVLSERTAVFTGVIVSPDVYLELFPGVAGPEQFAVDAADGTTTAEAEAAIEAAVVSVPDVSVYSNLQSKEQLNAQLDRAVAVVVAILGLAVVIAAIGMANTLSLAVHERTREIGLLRALGVTGRGVRAMLGVEAAMSSVVAAVMGVVVGVVFSWAAVASIPNLVFVVPWAQVALCVIVATLLGLLASVVPARRAARVSPVVALATD